MRRGPRLTTAVIAGLLSSGASLAEARVGQEHPFSRYARPERLVALPDGRRLNLRCSGQGKPVVILESGLGFPSLSWRLVQPEISRETRVCAYDRAGLGFSDPGSEPRTPQTSADDLALTLEAAGEPGPYVLVASSYGGLIATHFAARYADRVAGLVLVDPAEPGQDAAMALITPDLWASLKAAEVEDRACLDRLQTRSLSYEAAVAAGCASDIDPTYPEDLRLTLQTQRLNPVERRTAMSENAALRRIAADSRPPALLPGYPPLIVLTAGAAFASDDAYTPDQRADLAAVWRALHQRTAARSMRGEERLIEGAGHVIQSSRPDAVLTAMRDMLAILDAASGQGP